MYNSVILQIIILSVIKKAKKIKRKYCKNGYHYENFSHISSHYLFCYIVCSLSYDIHYQSWYYYYTFLFLLMYMIASLYLNVHIVLMIFTAKQVLEQRTVKNASNLILVKGEETEAALRSAEDKRQCILLALVLKQLVVVLVDKYAYQIK